jgi:serine/threonine-protein kinase HipA
VLRRLEVFLDWGTRKVPVGTLAENGRQLYFEFASAFLEDPLPISPFKLPVRPGLHEDKDRLFGGLFGVFNDSLPDGWGSLLMDRHFRQQGLSLSEISPLDRLAYIADRAMGALVYRPPMDLLEDGFTDLDLDVLAAQAQQLIEGDAKDVVPTLRIAGGSPGGARPKVLVGLRESDRRLVTGVEQLPEGFKYYLVKFGTKEEGPEIGPVEAAYALMARAADIDFPDSRLFETNDGGRYFGAERFDRFGQSRLHMHTLGGLLHASHRHPSLDYEGFLRATLALTRDYQQLEEAFRRMAFNVFAHNRDDHVKNFSFLMLPSGEWRLAPAYDLVFSAGIKGWHTMDVAGEAREPTARDMLTVATACDLKQPRAKELLEQVRAAVTAWRTFASETGVSNERARQIDEALARCCRPT